MITRRMWHQHLADEAAKLAVRDERRHTLTLVSWIQPDPKRHRRQHRADIRDAQISLAMLETPKGRVN